MEQEVVLFKVVMLLSNFILLIAMGCIAFLFTQLQKNRSTLMEYKVEATDKFASKNDVNAGFKRIEQKLDKLADDVHRGINRNE
jgi:hypothetical protein